MNNRGQMIGVGLFIGIFITVLVGIVLMIGSAQNLDEATHTETLLFDDTLDVIANDTSQYLTEWKYFESVTVYNETGHEIIPATSYTVVTNVINNGVETINFTPYARNYENTTNAWRINASNAQRAGYIPESGARSIAGLIIIFFALAIAMVALIPTLRNKIIDSI